MTDRVIRVAIADDEPAVREALADLIADEPSLELVGMAADADEAIALAIRERPDVALVDVKMPGGGGERAAREIRVGSPSTRVVALSAYEDRGTVLEILRAGAAGYLVKGASGQEIIDAIHRSARGQGTLAVEVTADVLDELAGQLERQEKAAAKRREQRERIQDVLEGLIGLDIALQPIVDLRTGDVVGAEALSRFEGEPPRGPDVWFAEARSVGLGPDLELLAVRLALRHLAAVPSASFVSLNVSPEVAVSTRLAELLDGEPVRRLVLEITEHARVEDYAEMLDTLRPLRDLGVRLAVDDAGAGYASLRHILQLSTDIIKIDMTLTRDIDTDRAKHALASALVGFAKEIGASIVAEGVETERELEALRDLGVEYGQGYFLARPSRVAPGETLPASMPLHGSASSHGAAGANGAAPAPNGVAPGAERLPSRLAD